MPLLTKLSKLKSLSPVIIIGSAVIITIKLLTTQTPSQEEIITVSVKEDILNTQYEDELDIPPPPPEQEAPPAQEEEEEVAKVEEEPEEEPEETTEDTAEDTEEDIVEEEAPASPPSPPPAPSVRLTWGKGTMPELMRRIIDSGKEK